MMLISSLCGGSDHLLIFCSMKVSNDSGWSFWLCCSAPGGSGASWMELLINETKYVKFLEELQTEVPAASLN